MGEDLLCGNWHSLYLRLASLWEEDLHCVSVAIGVYIIGSICIVCEGQTRQQELFHSLQMSLHTYTSTVVSCTYCICTHTHAHVHAHARTHNKVNMKVEVFPVVTVCLPSLVVAFSVLLRVSSTDMYGPLLLQSDRIFKLVDQIKRRLAREREFQRTSFQLLGGIDALLTAATATQRHSASIAGTVLGSEEGEA